jgi:flagellar biosynthesis/type III secretory pathway chaperone
MENPPSHLIGLVDQLRAVLEEERRALLSGTAEAIGAITQRKMVLADMLEQATVVPGVSRPSPDWLIPLMRYNQENAVICDAMLRHLTASIDKLRRRDPHRSYRSDGTEHSSSAQHALGAA